MTTLDIIEIVFIALIAICGFGGIVYVLLKEKSN